MASSPILEEVKVAMTEYYTLLSQMPHYPPNSLRQPPPEGWRDMDREAFRELGCSDEAIDFVSHLPCLDACLNSDRAWIAPCTNAVGYHRGYKWETRLEYDPAEGSIFPPLMPPHLFQIANYRPDDMGYSLLCLDTQQGTIIEMLDDGPRFKPGITEETYDAMPEEDQWMAYPSLRAKEFFALETTRLLRLVYVPVPPAIPERNYDAKPTFYERIPQRREHELAGLDDEPEADDEVFQPEEAQRVYEIYKNNGWPDAHFNVEQCRKELLSFARDLEDEEDRLDREQDEEDHASEEWCEQERQQIKSGRLKKGEPWDEEKEESQSAVEWYAANCNDLADPEELPDDLEHFKREEQKQKRIAHDTLIVPSERWCKERREAAKKRMLAEGKLWDEEDEKRRTARECWAEVQEAEQL